MNAVASSGSAIGSKRVALRSPPPKTLNSHTPHTRENAAATGREVT